MIHNIADVTPGGSAVVLANTRTPANWVLVAAATGNAADLRIGDSTTGAASGATIPKGTALLLPAISDDLYLDLAQIYLYGSGSDKGSILYGRH